MQHINTTIVTHITGQHIKDRNFSKPPFYHHHILTELKSLHKDRMLGTGKVGTVLEFNVNDSSFSVIFSANPCYQNPLYDPQCQGYANALFLQQCTTNPLFDPTCPEYATAYLNQQCSANPLYDPVLNMQRQVLHNNVIGIHFLMYNVQTTRKHG